MVMRIFFCVLFYRYIPFAFGFGEIFYCLLVLIFLISAAAAVFEALALACASLALSVGFWRVTLSPVAWRITSSSP